MAKGTLMEMVGADWIRSMHREDDLAGRPGSIVQVFITFLSMYSFIVHDTTNISCKFLTKISVAMFDSRWKRILFHHSHTSRYKLHFVSFSLHVDCLGIYIS